MFLNNKDLYYEIVVSKAQGFLTRKATLMLELLANNAIKRLSYFKDTDREDCLQTGMLVLYSNWYNFSEDKGNNAFAYFTEVFKRASTKGLKQLYDKKGDKDGSIKLFSIESSNDGMGLHSL